MKVQRVAATGRRRQTVVVLVLALLALLGGPAWQAAAAPPVTPTLIAASVSSGYTAPCQPPDCAVPEVLVQAGAPFQVTVTLSANGAPAAFTKDTPLTLTAPGPGTLSPRTVTMPADTTSFTFTGVTYSTYTNGVTVTASASVKKGAPASTPSNAFDVLQTLKTTPASPHSAFQDGVGGADNCADVTATNPVCGVLLLPNGANSDVLLSTGSCLNIGCNTQGLVIQVIADLSSQPLYSPGAPATLVIHCDRSVCGKGGVNKYTALASLSATGPLAPAPACPAKGTLGATQDFCTDYVQSTRSNSDDLLLFLLFDHDFRGSA